MMVAAQRAFLLVVFIAGAEAHGAMTQPKSRNAIDGDVLPWNGSVPEVRVFIITSIEISNHRDGQCERIGKPVSSPTL
eukprot:SAG11_NODE_2556_length_3223_cov_1.668054_2_plen_78_part_00